jgi:hypothetical protein
LLGLNYRTLLVCRNLGPREGIEDWCNRLLHAEKRFQVIYSGSRGLAQQLTDDILKGMNALSKVPGDDRFDKLAARFQEIIREFEARSELGSGRDPAELRVALLELSARADRLSELAIRGVVAASLRHRTTPSLRRKI